MKKILSFLILFLIINTIYGQVGIGTTSPDPSSQLDITATDKGILIPRVSLSDVTDTSLDGTTAAVTGLLIFNTNATVTGGSGTGYYYFDGTVWERLSTSTSGGDHDFYEEGTTTSPDDISDDVFTEGNVAIGKNTADYSLDIETEGDRAINATIDGSDNNLKYGQFTTISNSGTGQHYGTYNELSGTGGSIQTGTYTEFAGSSSGENNGLHNDFTGDAFMKRGVYNTFNEGNAGFQYGLYNDFNTSNVPASTDYGVYTTMTGNTLQNVYGIYHYIADTGGGTHYGIYNEMRDGLGYQYGFYNSLNLNNSNDGTGMVNEIFANASNEVIAVDNIFGGEIINIKGVENDFGSVSDSFQSIGISNRFTNSGLAHGSNNFGAYNVFDNTSNGSQYGVYNQVDTTVGTVYGLYNIMSSGGGDQYGVLNFMTSSDPGNKYGTSTTIDPTAGGVHYGIYSDVRKAGSFAGYFTGAVSIGSDGSGTDTYTLPASRGTNGQIMQTDGIGNVGWVDSPAMPTPSYGEIFKTIDSPGTSTGVPINFNTAGPSNNTVMDPTYIQVTTAGTYRITYTILIEKFGTSTIPIGFHLRELFGGTGTIILGSRVYIASQNYTMTSLTKSILYTVNSPSSRIYVYPESNSSVTILSGSSLSVELID